MSNNKNVLIESLGFQPTMIHKVTTSHDISFSRKTLSFIPRNSLSIHTHFMIAL